MAMQEPGRPSGFSCKQCGMVYLNMPLLMEHMDTHQQEEERKFKCDECGRGYRHAGSLANHKKTHDVGSFQCNICGKENSNALALKNHLRSHTSQKKYLCLECGKAFRLASQLATHERVHEARQTREHSVWKEDTEHVTCADQNKTQNGHMIFFPSAGAGVSDDKTDVISGTQTETDDSLDRPFKCDLCDKSYIHHRSLTNHKKTHQTGMFECTVCFKLFNNMAALYSHQRTHKSKSQIDSFCGSYTGASLDQFSPQSQDAPGNFCHLCQVLFPNNEDFEEHIQIHNSSSLSFEAQDGLSQNDNALYDNNMVCPESTFYTSSPVNNVASASSRANVVAVDLSNEQITSNGHFYTDCSNHETSSNSTQGQPPIIDPNILAQTQNANNIDKTPRGVFEDRPFKCNICFKSYRHSGSLINHKRSHQVGIYQCFICGKNYPHLAALKSHLRIHKAQPTSLNPRREWDWLSFKPLTLENQQGCFSHEKDIIHPALGTEQENRVGLANRALFSEHFNQELPSDVTVQLPHNDNLMQRHMCADCGQTFADIAGIKSHSCPLLQQQQNTTRNHYNSSNLHLQDSGTVEDPGSNLDFSGLKTEYNQSCFEKKFPEDVNNDSGRAGEEEESNDGDFFQCSICGNGYSSMRSLRSHLRGHTQSHSTPSCSDPSSMSSHDEVKEEAGEMMICSTCGETFANKQDLDNHQLLHSKDQSDESQQTNECDVRNENVICGSCGIFYHHLESHGCMPDTNHKPATTEDEMKGQNNMPCLVNEVIEDRQYQCEQCGRSYRHAASLLNHKKSHKTGVFRCHVCQKRFYNQLALKNHQRSHFDIKRYTCHECGKAFKIQRQLLNHLRRHKEKQAKIQELNNQIQALQKNESRSDEGMQSLSANASQAFNQIQDKMQEALKELKPEAAIKSEDHNDKRPFACDQCGRTYRHAGSLVNHKNSHKTGQYYCSICNNTYSNQLAMKNHLRTHFAFKRHSCQKCGKRFRAKRQLLVHVCANLRNEGSDSRRGFKSRLFKCEECKQAFPSLKQLTAHKCDGTSVCSDQTNVSKEERPFTCNICNRSYRHAGSLLNHKNTHKTGHYVCTLCSKHFTNPMALRNHTRIHTQRKKYVCLTCGKAFRLASILYNHQKVHNLVASHFICPACGKSFQGRSGLKRHRCCSGQGSASGVPQSDRRDKCFMCDLCGRSYRHAGSLLNHKKTHSENLHHCTLCLQTFPDLLSLQSHSQMTRQCCPECGKTFCLASHLQSHMEVHSKGQSVVCSVCQQSFPNTASLQQHQNTHHSAQGPYTAEDNGMTTGAAVKEEPPPLSHIAEKANDTANAEEKGHVCEHCGRTYRHAGSLLNHKNSHKTGSFFCSVCQKEFTNLMALKNHRRIHTEPKRYQCVECGKAFRVSAQLICHRRIHSKEKPFTCLLCDKSFSSKSNLRHHQKMHQNTTNEPPFNTDTNAFMDLDLSAFL